MILYFHSHLFYLSVSGDWFFTFLTIFSLLLFAFSFFHIHVFEET